MCGVVSYWSYAKPIEEQKLAVALNTIVHRGPDAIGTWLSDDHCLALGHVRLSIIDLHSGSQPLVSQDKQIHAVVNGEFYDFESIRDDLKTKGYHFNSHSDSEILIALYQEYGTECLAHLRGEFAFVLWEEKNQYLFAARDRFGIKPLFYTIHNGAIYFASEMKALFLMGVPARWDIDGVRASESLMPMQDVTLFKDIKAITPGHYLIAKPDSVKSYCYWDFNYPNQGKISEEINEQELIQEFRNVLEDAVKTRLRSDVPVGCYLSGGLDSCAVLGLMAEHRGKDIDTFTISFEEELYDEGDIALEMSRKVQSRHHTFDVTNQSLGEVFADALYHSESIIYNNHSVAKYLLSKHTHNAGYKVILTGEGSDEVLCGYPNFRADMLRYDSQGQDPSVINEMLKQLNDANKASTGLLANSGTMRDLSSAKEFLNFIPSMFKVTSMTGHRVLELSKDEHRRQSLEHDPYMHFLNRLDHSQFKDTSPLTASMYLWSKSMLPGFILVQLGDRMEMSHSIEGRVPFLDHNVVEFLTRVPNSMKLKGMTEKYLLREAVKDVITDTVYKRQKHPFIAPPSIVKDNPFLELMKDVFYSDALKHHPFYDQQKVLTKLESMESMTVEGRQEYNSVFMYLLSSCLLQQRFNIQV